MSNAMSMSKSRWKGALLATVAASVLSPLAAKAQSMSISMTLSPLGGSGFQHAEYIAPDATVPVYIYATVTGASAISSSYIDGLQYLYYNVNQPGGINTSDGKIISATPNAALGFNANGSQSGATNFSSGTLGVGDSSVMTSMAKPRSGSPVWSSTSAADGTNIIVSGNSISFLVETLQYKPSFTPLNAVQGGGTATNSLNLSIPSLGTGYAASNYFVGEPTTPSFGANQGGGAAFTFTGYNVSGTGVTLLDAAAGDINLDGAVNSLDLGIMLHNYSQPVSGFGNGDLNGDGSVNSLDLGILLHNYSITYGTVTPNAGIASQVGGSAVPEPTSLSLLGLGSLALMRRRNRA